MNRKRLGSELEFISRINRDGSGTQPIPDRYLEKLHEETFRLSSLSLTLKTYVAIGFNSYVVKLKSDE